MTQQTWRVGVKHFSLSGKVFLRAEDPCSGASGGGGDWEGKMTLWVRGFRRLGWRRWSGRGSCSALLCTDEYTRLHCCTIIATSSLSLSESYIILLLLVLSKYTRSWFSSIDRVLDSADKLNMPSIMRNKKRSRTTVHQVISTLLS